MPQTTPMSRPPATVAEAYATVMPRPFSHHHS